VIAALLGATPFVVGCGGGDDGSERAVEWHVDRDGVVGPRSARITAVVETCIAPVWLERPIIEYSGERAYVELRHTPEKGEGEHNGCFLGLSVLHKTATFERDLDELVLFDASTDPPEQRWPRWR
jgi:hypothetical protein